MAISVDIPVELLKAVDRPARALRISRNRLMLRALERELEQGSEWDVGFIEKLRAVDDQTVEDTELMLTTISAQRRSKEPPRL